MEQKEKIFRKTRFKVRILTFKKNTHIQVKTLKTRVKESSRKAKKTKENQSNLDKRNFIMKETTTQCRREERDSHTDRLSTN